MTNREWMNTLSDEEFAGLRCTLPNPDCYKIECKENCHVCYIDWLKQEHKEVSDEQN